MSFLTFIIELYFASVLGVSGLTKLENPQKFTLTLRQQKIFPTWSIEPARNILPWVEIIIAFLLLTGAIQWIMAVFVLFLFLIFLLLKIILLKAGYTEDCGCYGNAQPDKIDNASVITSVIFVVLATLHFGLVLRIESVTSLWRLIGSILFVGGCLFCLVKIVVSNNTFSSIHFLQDSGPGGLDIGEYAPSFVATDQEGNIVSLEDFQGQRRLLMFVSPGCPSCPRALDVLRQALLSEFDLAVLVVGSPNHESNRLYARNQKIYVPFLTPDADLVEKHYRIRGFPLVFILDAKRDHSCERGS